MVGTDASAGKESACQFRRHRLDPWVWKIPWRKKWQHFSIFLLGKFHGQRSLMGYSPWSHKDLDKTENMRTHTLLETREELEQPGMGLLGN